MSQGMDDIRSITYDWIARVLYFAMSDANQTLNIWSLPVDNPLFQFVHNATVLSSNDSGITMTTVPFTKYANSLHVLILTIVTTFVLLSIDNCIGQSLVLQLLIYTNLIFLINLTLNYISLALAREM